MAYSSFPFNTLQRRELSSFSICKCFSTPSINSHFSFSPSFAFSSPKHTLFPKFYSFVFVKTPLTAKTHVNIRTFPSLINQSSLTDTICIRNISESQNSGDFSHGSVDERVEQEKFRKGFVNNGKRLIFSKRRKKGSGFSSSRLNNERSLRKMEEIVENIPINNNGYARKAFKFDSIGKKDYGFSSKRGKDANLDATAVNGDVHRRSIRENDHNHGIKVKKEVKLGKKNKGDSPEFQLRIGLDKCSKMGNVMGAISLYDLAVKQGVKMGQYHYTVLLYLCSSAALGVVRPAKSGSGSRSLDTVASQTLNESSDNEEEDDEDEDDEDNDALDMKDQAQKLEMVEIRVSDDVKKHALEKGFEIYERMCLEEVKMNEAALTSVARMAMAMGDGDMAFDMVKQMKSMGINPKLRSYGPALSAYSNSGEVEKAFDVEKHMLEDGVRPEEPELEALLRVSIQTGKADRVYYLLHKLRTNVRAVSPSTADLIEKWFKSKEASRIGKRKWDPEMMAQTMDNVGGGWHGKGWLGRGNWVVSQTSVGADGVCNCCGEELALIDLDPEETERFAESVASIAVKREKNSSFQKFQKWLDYHGPFEAVVDAANVGLFSQRKFKPSKVNVVVNGIRQMLPWKKWPLIILHNRRLTESKMDKPVNRALVDRWSNADALYATPTGSNDDWYWLYAAIKFKCLIVTNDEMRDHTFQLLGTDFFPKWKERHQVRFSFSEIGPVFHMPPPCSVVIQESKWGHWHIPVASECQSEGDRIWLCILRPSLPVNKLNPKVGAHIVEDDELKDEKEHEAPISEPRLQAKAQPVARSKRKCEEPDSKHPKDLRNILSESFSSNTAHTPIWKAINAAEKLSGSMIDFQI